jgi:tripartite-type tricarboxylate transporter receptor subunit TctC
MNVLGKVVVAATLAAGISVGALAQTWPAKPVRIVLGAAAGTAPDTIGRMLADKFTASMGQSFVIENRPGAAATLAAMQVMKSPADGYTIMFAVAAGMATGPHLMPNAKYHPANDFAPIGFIQRAPYYIVVRTDLPIQSLQDLIAYGKSKPGELNFATPGIGTLHHLTLELLMMQSGARFTHVPLAGTVLAITETLGGRTHATIDNAGVQFAAQVKAGKLRMIAMTGATSQRIFPGVKTMGEQGLALESYAWWGLVAPMGTPREIILRMNAELNKALASPDLIERQTAEGAIIDSSPGSTPEAFGNWIAAEYERWGKVIKEAGIRLN